MKKLFIVLAIASLGFVSCKNSSESNEGEKKDTIVTEQPQPAAMDTTSQAAPVMDTTGAQK